MVSQPEVDRLRQVYQQYADQGFGLSKWSLTNPGNLAIRVERESRMRELLQRAGFFPLSGRRILDVGCGTGELIGLFLEWGANAQNLVGIDLIPDRVRSARLNYPELTFQVANAESMPFPDGSFDLVVVFTVFTSILDIRMTHNISREIDRVLRAGGSVLWYDFRVNNPFNRHVRGLSRRRVRSLFPGFNMALEAISLLPPLARRLGGLADRLYGPLVSARFLRTHLLGLLNKPGSAPEPATMLGRTQRT